MDDIIQKLIEFDRQCVEKVELAKKKKAEAQSSMMSQKSTIYSEYIDSQQDQVEKHKQDLLNKNKEEAQLQENEFHLHTLPPARYPDCRRSAFPAGAPPFH